MAAATQYGPHTPLPVIGGTVHFFFSSSSLLILHALQYPPPIHTPPRNMVVVMGGVKRGPWCWLEAQGGYCRAYCRGLTFVTVVRELHHRNFFRWLDVMVIPGVPLDGDFHSIQASRGSPS